MIVSPMPRLAEALPPLERDVLVGRDVVWQVQLAAVEPVGDAHQLGRPEQGVEGHVVLADEVDVAGIVVLPPMLPALEVAGRLGPLLGRREVADLRVVPVDDDIGGDPLRLGPDGDRRAVHVGPAHHQHLVSRHALLAGEDVGRQVCAGQMAEMARARGVWPATATSTGVVIRGKSTGDAGLILLTYDIAAYAWIPVAALLVYRRR